ncbi:class I SAM-dependent methyltransferase [Psychromonas sp. MME2]|uniref:class I SAM-dependent methyltransferase n=1 Tax=unclassified Psychromonas TaxID=2614957 RepID=UPI00339C2D52
MILEKNWRILTIGDGDLSFSNALQTTYGPATLTATVYDSLEAMRDKYDDLFYQQLTENKIQVLFEFDVTAPKTWQGLTKHSFDLVIFQFPLLPGFKSLEEYKARCNGINVNTLNRALLRSFLVHSFAHFLDPKGQQLCFITSKDVNPYRQWNIENALHIDTDIHYLGSSPFNIDNFPNYRVRNVDRDKHVKDTRGITYAWSLHKNHSLAKQLTPAMYQLNNCCSMCQVGPFINEVDRNKHNNSVKHKKMVEFEKLWAIKLSE